MSRTNRWKSFLLIFIFIALSSGLPTVKPKPYQFSYIVNDTLSGNEFGHMESSDGEIVIGQYHVLLPDGQKQTVTFTSDSLKGYQAEVTYTNQSLKAADPSANEVACVDPFINLEGQCIKIINNIYPNTWADHRLECMMIGGSDLLEVKEKSLPSLRRYLNRIPHYIIFIGGHRSKTEGTFKWPSGKTVKLNWGWAKGEPNNKDGIEDCMIIEANRDGTFNDVPCSKSHGHSLCEMFPTSPQIPTEAIGDE